MGAALFILGAYDDESVVDQFNGHQRLFFVVRHLDDGVLPVCQDRFMLWKLLVELQMPQIFEITV